MEDFYVIGDVDTNEYIKRIRNLISSSSSKNICIDNILYLIQLCEVFASIDYESKNIIAIKCNNFLKLDKDKKVYFSTDHHGDMAALLHSLLKSGVAKYKRNKTSIIYFDMESGCVIDENISNISDEKLFNIIPIPNLIINEDFKDQLILNGDIIDRGAQSDSCFCLLYYLLNQKGCDNKIVYLLGNHENTILSHQFNIYDTPLISENSAKITIKKGFRRIKFNINVRNTNNYKCFIKLMNNLVLENKLKLCTNIDNVIFSHTFFEKTYITKCIDNYIKEDHPLIYSKFNFNTINDLNENIKQDIELNTNEIELLTEFINTCLKLNCISDAKDKYNVFDDNEGNNGLLWSRNYSDCILGVKQVIGHSIVSDASYGANSKIYSNILSKADVFGPYNEINNFKPEFIKDFDEKVIKIIKSDVMQSSGYRKDNTNATLFYFDGNSNYLEIENELIFKDKINCLYKELVLKKIQPNIEVINNYMLCLEALKNLDIKQRSTVVSYN